MKKSFLIIIALLLFSSFLILRSRNQTPSPTNHKPTVTVRKHTFLVELALSPTQQETGLSYRSSLDEESAMLFVFEKPRILTFWMKDMNFPLDIIFIKDNKIVTIHKDVPKPRPDTDLTNLPRYSPKEPANYVLEINAGLSDRYGFREGDQITYANIRN